jgi:hypothetical protein
MFILCSLGELIKEEEVAMAMAHKLLSFANLVINLKPRLNNLNEQCTTIKGHINVWIYTNFICPKLII